MKIAIAHNGRTSKGDLDPTHDALGKGIPAVCPRDKSVKKQRLEAGQSQ
jgi:hypothetical protein